jgi:hypothetical protein
VDNPFPGIQDDFSDDGKVDECGGNWQNHFLDRDGAKIEDALRSTLKKN